MNIRIQIIYQQSVKFELYQLWHQISGDVRLSVKLIKRHRVSACVINNLECFGLQMRSLWWYQFRYLFICQCEKQFDYKHLIWNWKKKMALMINRKLLHHLHTYNIRYLNEAVSKTLQLYWYRNRTFIFGAFRLSSGIGAFET